MGGQLPAPIVDEVVGSSLDIDPDGTAPVTVRVPPYPGMAANDVITVCWQVMHDRREVALRVPGAAVGRSMVFRIHHASLTSVLPVEVSYTVEWAGGPADAGVSRTLVLNPPAPGR
ncbi:hypothetical protein ACIBCM_31205 [Streptomyces sp. NPDC051018]|uniref:hypothetical protein n=1 Tax=Streptomyces sp. NPDC051018 TaxID=3365639 RepID=UPI00379BC939